MRRASTLCDHMVEDGPVIGCATMPRRREGRSRVDPREGHSAQMNASGGFSLPLDGKFDALERYRASMCNTDILTLVCMMLCWSCMRVIARQRVPYELVVRPEFLPSMLNPRAAAGERTIVDLPVSGAAIAPPIISPHTFQRPCTVSFPIRCRL
jgi:hypothetical protein